MSNETKTNYTANNSGVYSVGNRDEVRVRDKEESTS